LEIRIHPNEQIPCINILFYNLYELLSQYFKSTISASNYPNVLPKDIFFNLRKLLKMPDLLETLKSIDAIEKDENYL
jgi:hypothetical protein